MYIYIYIYTHLYIRIHNRNLSSILTVDVCGLALFSSGLFAFSLFKAIPPITTTTTTAAAATTAATTTTTINDNISSISISITILRPSRLLHQRQATRTPRGVAD